MDNQNHKIKLYVAFFLPVVIASLIRFWDIGLRPLHSDEGVNSFFLRNLFDSNYYHYDPTNYHGPFLYYIGLIPFYILGLTDFAFRLMPALFGIMVVALLYPLRRRLGNAGLLTTGLLIAISPADSFFSRDTIHEIYLIFFSLAVVVSIFLYSESRKSRYIYFAAASMAFTITVKETFVITFAVFGASLFIAYLSSVLRVRGSGLKNKEPAMKLKVESSKLKGGIQSSIISDCWKRKYTIVVCIVMFFFINVLFYSSFFTYYKGINGILTTLSVWKETGTHSVGGHAKPFIYYFTILRKFELPVLVLGVCGFYYAFKDNKKFTVFIVSWAVLIYLAYSLVPYKTPWLILNMTLPLSISGGIFVNGIYKKLKAQSAKVQAESSKLKAQRRFITSNEQPASDNAVGSWQFAVGNKEQFGTRNTQHATRSLQPVWYLGVFYSVYVSIFGLFCYQSIVLNFVNYDDDRYELVYVQTNRDIYNFLDALELLSEAGGKDMIINVIAESYWPLPWYLREYKNAKFWGKSIANPDAPVILVDRKGQKSLEKKLKGSYETKRFALRPGVWLIAYIQKDLYEAVYKKKTVIQSQNQNIVKSVTIDELEPGLMQRCYYNVECLGKPFLSIVKNDSVSFAYDDPSKKPYRSPFGIEWTGYLLIKQEGLYQFATRSDDGSRVYINSEMIVDNDGFHAVEYVSSMVFLDQGLHHIRIVYFDGGGGAIMELLWTPPGSREGLVPGELMFHRVGDK
ncbi:MAG: flippase activity-associated protein Agl23 [Candidatus Anammoxibacter sp.]